MFLFMFLFPKGRFADTTRLKPDVYLHSDQNIPLSSGLTAEDWLDAACHIRSGYAALLLHGLNVARLPPFSFFFFFF